MKRPLLATLFLSLSGWTGMSCATPGSEPSARAVSSPAVRISERVGQGDAPRRAATRMVVLGLETDAPAEAVAHFERALQVDPSNAWAYLALARHEVFEGDPRRALAFVDKSEALLGSYAESLGARPHLDGIRGAALRPLGSAAESSRLLESAAASAVWRDGVLDAWELR